MSSPRPLEQLYLAPATRVLDKAVQACGGDPGVVRLEILEAVASRLAGWDLEEYRTISSPAYEVDAASALSAALGVLQALAVAAVPPSLALCALARPDLSAHVQRKDGVFYTDFRLARYLATRLAKGLGVDSQIVDPASGTGILLVATVLAVCGEDRVDRARMLAKSVCAADLSAHALRGARLALASVTEDLDAVAALSDRMRVHDSLIEGREGWADVAPAGFRAVVGNPPWEKVKVTRHELLRAAGTDRHYGDDYALAAGSDVNVAVQRRKAARYAMTLSEMYPYSGTGEADLYKAFFELAMRLASPSGRVALLVPAGLIRSQGTHGLRRLMLDSAAEVDIAILENRARFFAIDTRFKFLVLHAGLAGGKRSHITVRHARGTEDGVGQYGAARIGRRQLAAVRADVSVPEVRNDAEWQLFQQMSKGGALLGDDAGWWQPRIVREVDMTRDRQKFVRTAAPGHHPLVEGRMVHQFRSGAKSYVSGTGRRALWEPNPLGLSETAPQFWIANRDLPASAWGRVQVARIGFCDVTGQTNERTILATRIPSGLVCGNKVPTITFSGGAADDPMAQDLWLAVANSFAFDWLARRVVTTTVNFFLLLGLPFPKLQPGGLPARRLSTLAKDVMDLDRAGPVDPSFVAEKRAAMDVGVASAYGLTLPQLELVMKDFPLLDRGQPAIPGEVTSTVTRDLLLTRAASAFGEPGGVYAARLEVASAAGAIAYVPAQYTGMDQESGELLGS